VQVIVREMGKERKRGRGGGEGTNARASRVKRQ